MTDTHCLHGDQCAKREKGGTCEEGMREDVYVVEGALLPIWKVLIDNRYGNFSCLVISISFSRATAHLLIAIADEM